MNARRSVLAPDRSSSDSVIDRNHSGGTWHHPRLDGLGMVEDTVDAEGRLSRLLLGAAAAPPVDDADVEAIAEHVKSRALAVNIAGLLAMAREEGIEPEHQYLANEFRDTAQPGGHDNTCIHYALELRIRAVAGAETCRAVSNCGEPKKA